MTANSSFRREGYPTQRDADERYNSRRVIKRISFNIMTEADLLDFAENLPNFSRVVKDCLRKEMERLNEEKYAQSQQSS